jgi:hypothetical protein
MFGYANVPGKIDLLPKFVLSWLRERNLDSDEEYFGIPRFWKAGLPTDLRFNRKVEMREVRISRKRLSI